MRGRQTASLAASCEIGLLQRGERVLHGEELLDVVVVDDEGHRNAPCRRQVRAGTLHSIDHAACRRGSARDSRRTACAAADSPTIPAPRRAGEMITFGMSQSGLAAVHRLGLDDVEAGAGDAAFPERGDQRGLVDDAAAGDIDDDGAGLHRRELRRAEHVTARLVAAGADRDRVGDRQRVVQALARKHLLDVAVASGVRDTAIGRALTALSLRASSRPIGPRPMTHTTASSSDDDMRGHLRALPVMGALARHQVRQSPHQCEQQQQRVFGHIPGPDAGRVGHDHAVRDAHGDPVIDPGRGEMHPAQRLAVAAQRLAGRAACRCGCWSHRSQRRARRAPRPRARRPPSSRAPESPW